MAQPDRPQYLAEILLQTYVLFFKNQGDLALQSESLMKGIEEDLRILFKRMDYDWAKNFCERFEGDPLLRSLLPIVIEKCPDNVEEFVSLLAFAEGDFSQAEYSSSVFRTKITGLIRNVNFDELEMMIEDALAPNTKAARATENFVNSCRQ